MKPLYVFDFDGTLVDSVANYTRATLRIFEENGISYPPDIMTILTPLSFSQTAEYFVQAGAKGTCEELAARLGQSLMDEYAHHIYTKPFVREALQKIKGEGNRLFILSASPHVAIEACMANNGLTDLFEQVFSCDDFGLPKGNVNIYLQLADRLGCKPRDIRFFDDNLLALKAAEQAGFCIRGVFDDHSDYTHAQMAAVSPDYISSFEELL